MKIIDTFTIVDESLLAVRFEDKEFNEFRGLFNSWNDPEFLHKFFTTHQKDLNRHIWNHISVEEAIHKTRAQAKWMEKKILDLAESGKKTEHNLSEYFQPLSDTYVTNNYLPTKGTGLNNPSWLRIYALKLDENFFMVTGGGIKLVPTMNERAHLLLELEKINIVKKYLNNSGEAVVLT